MSRYRRTITLRAAALAPVTMLAVTTVACDGPTTPRSEFAPSFSTNSATTSTPEDYGLSETHSFQALIPNFNHPDADLQALMRDVRFRRALSHLADRSRMVDPDESPDFAGSRALFAVTEPVHVVHHNPDVTRFGYDPAAAEALLDEIGIVDQSGDGYRDHLDGTPLTLDIVTNAGGGRVERSDIIAADMDAVGLQVAVTVVPFFVPPPCGVPSIFCFLLFDRSFDLMYIGFSTPRFIVPGAGRLGQSLFDLRAFPFTAWNSGPPFAPPSFEPFELDYGDIVIDMEAALATGDYVASRKAAHEAQEVLAQNQPLIVTVHTEDGRAGSTEALEGLIINIAGGTAAGFGQEVTYVGMNLPPSSGVNRLLAKLEKALAKIRAGKNRGARNKLRAFIDQIRDELDDDDEDDDDDDEEGDDDEDDSSLDRALAQLLIKAAKAIKKDCCVDTGSILPQT